VGQLALALKKPVIAVQMFGGTAAEIFDQEERRYLQMPEVANNLYLLTDFWDSLKSAEGVISTAEILAGRHTHFLSYSRQNQEQTDHLEALLRRRARIVCRDEEALKLTEEIKEKLADLIERADTFIAVWSKDSAASEWCRWERKVAEECLRKKGLRHKRILFLALDDTPLPRPWTHFLQSKGTCRLVRAKSVAGMIEQEFICKVGGYWESSRRW
jgi:hypothetical protein